MNLFPAADPIPLPAPVWLIKLLSLLTLGLHFAAVMILVGSLILVIWLNVRGRAQQSRDTLHAAYTLAKRLPVLMTFVVNLGVPPLLFVQVLYGRQIYSSSVLIGTMWASVIFLLMLAYWLIYRVLAAMESGRAAWPLALASLLIVMGIGQIYSMNMTLMLHPEAWAAMYHKSPQGLQGFTGDPTTTSRWMFVMAGGPLFGGLWAALLSQMAYLPEAVQTILRKTGSSLAIVGAALMFFFGWRVMVGQTEAVSTGLAQMPLYSISLLACAATIVLAGVLGLVQFARPFRSVWVPTLGILVAFLAAASAGVVRDGIRDLTLKAQGFNVFDTPVYPNWSVLVVFLLLFVLMLGIIFWLLQVMRQATAPKEEIAL